LPQGLRGGGMKKKLYKRREKRPQKSVE
jgi:hypothetical protein